MARKPLIAGAVGAVVVIIVLVAFMMNRGAGGEPTTTPVAGVAADAPTPTAPTESATSDAPTPTAPAVSAAAPAPAKTSAPAPAKTTAAPPAVDSYARFAHPPTANGTAGSASGTNKYEFPVDQISPTSSEIRVHVSGSTFSESVLCLRPAEATICRATWTAPSHNIKVNYYLTVEPADSAHYRPYRSATLSFDVP